jgi:preprotein translocase subunit SecD
MSNPILLMKRRLCLTLLATCASLSILSPAQQPEKGLRISEVMEKASAETKDFKEAQGVKSNGDLITAVLHISNQAIITGADIQSCTPRSSNNEWDVLVTLTPQGGKKFHQATQALLGKRLAILVDENFISAPVLYSAIPDGNIVISGNFTEERIKKLVASIESVIPAKPKKP